MTSTKENQTKGYKFSLRPYYCQYCRVRFSRFDYFQRHRSKHLKQKHHTHTGFNQIHNGEITERKDSPKEDDVDEVIDMEEEEEYFKCEHCEQQFFSKFALEGHLACHAVQPLHNSPAKPFLHNFLSGIASSPVSLYSPPCGVVTTTSPMLSPPSSEEFNTVFYKCRYCPKSFTIGFDKEAHERLHFRQKYSRSFQCGYCSQSFTSKAVCKLHQRTHLQGEFFSCNGCTFSSLSKKQLSIHKKKHCPKTKKRKFKCTTCNKKLSSKVKLVKHLQVHVREEIWKQKFSREILDGSKSVESPESQEEGKQESVSHHLENFEEQLPSEDINELDYYIGESVDTASAPNGHELAVIASRTSKTLKVKWEKLNGETLYTCSFCGKTFSNQDALNSHRKFHVKRSKIYYGSLCESKSADGQTLFTCDLCRKTFSSRMALISHRRTHVQASKVSKSPDNVQKQNLHRCDECDKTFNNKTVLLGHKQTHLKRKRSEVSTDVGQADDRTLHTCNECDKTFSDGTMLCSHLRNCERKRARVEMSNGNEMSNGGNEMSNGNQMSNGGNEKGDHISHDCNGNDTVTGSPLESDETTGQPKTSLILNGEINGHKCNYCGKSFSSKRSLTSHRRTHTKQPTILNWVNIKNAQTPRDESRKAASGETNLLSSKRSGGDDCGKNKPKTCVDESSLLSPKRSCGDNSGKNKPKTCIDESRLLSPKRSGGGKNKPKICVDESSLLSPKRSDGDNHGKNKPKTCIDESSLLSPKRSGGGKNKPKICVDESSLLSPKRSGGVDHGKNKPKTQVEYICDQCEKKVSTKAALTSHKRSHTNKSEVTKGTGESQSLKCTECQMSFQSAEPLTYHVVEYRGVRKCKEFKCDTCEKCFVDESCLMKHTCIRCDACDKCFLFESCLAKHKCRARKKERTKTNDNQCKQCGRCYKRKGDLTRHVLTHSGVKPFACQHCDMSFARKFYLQRHENSHTGAVSYKCHFCDETFSSPDNRHYHELKHKPMENKFSCNSCDKSFTFQSALTYHVETVHASHKKYKCEYCAKTFGQKGDLNIHERVHKGEKPYKCVHAGCPSAFKSKTHLSRHLKCKHSGENYKIFQCNLCVKNYSERRYLEHHLEKKHRNVKKKYKLVIKLGKKASSPKPSSDCSSSDSESSSSDTDDSSDSSDLPSDLESVSSFSSNSETDTDTD